MHRKLHSLQILREDTRQMKPESTEPAVPPKRLNSFQILGAVLSGASGVRGVSKRDVKVSNASTGAILGAILIFCAFLGLGLYLFVNAVQNTLSN
tara:strand:+ start:1346 stop:1630 length:285 start_codon:yes stop_codon:yes gene_type:complete